MKLTRNKVFSDRACSVLWAMSRQIDRMEASPLTPLGVVISNRQANYLQEDLNHLEGCPVITNCTYRGHPILIDELED
jgi:hypothetical protein